LDEIKEVERECQKRRQEMFACEHENNNTLASLHAATEEAKSELKKTDSALKENSMHLDKLQKEVNNHLYICHDCAFPSPV